MSLFLSLSKTFDTYCCVVPMCLLLKLELNRGAGFTRDGNMARVQVDVEGGVVKNQRDVWIGQKPD